MRDKVLLGRCKLGHGPSRNLVEHKQGIVAKAARTPARKANGACAVALTREDPLALFIPQHEHDRAVKVSCPPSFGNVRELGKQLVVVGVESFSVARMNGARIPLQSYDELRIASVKSPFG